MSQAPRQASGGASITSKFSNSAGFGPDAAMVLGLKAVRGDLFAVLEEDDFWLCGHITSLLTLAETARPGRAYAYSGVLQVEEPAAGDNAGSGRAPPHPHPRPVGGRLSISSQP